VTPWRVIWCLVPLGLAFAAQDRFTLSILALAAVQALYAASWDLAGGVSGRPTLGHALPLGTAAYAAALISGWGLAPPPVAVAVGALAGGLIGTLQGVLVARLDRIAVALVTLATAECGHEISRMVRFLWRGGITVGGDSGIPAFVYPTGEAAAARLAAGVLAAGLIGLVWIAHSGPGLAMRVARADDRLAAASGIDVARVRVLALTVAGATAGLAGGLMASLVGRASPSMLALESSLFAIAAAGVGGLGSIIGPAAVAYAVAAAFQWLDISGTVRLAVYALMLIAAGLAPSAAAALGGARRGRA
jgi:branched-chain amino acid transport system permease protein